VAAPLKERGNKRVSPQPLMRAESKKIDYQLTLLPRLAMMLNIIAAKQGENLPLSRFGVVLLLFRLLGDALFETANTLAESLRERRQPAATEQDQENDKNYNQLSRT
jgi:hypothetical protein